MPVKNIGIVIIFVGIFGFILSLSIDIFGLGDGGIGAAQLLGAQAGLIVAVIGFGLWKGFTGRSIDIQKIARSFVTWLLTIPISIWVLSGFLLVYLFFFVFPVFFNDDLRMHYPTRYIPDRYPIGMDLQFTLDLVKSWVKTGQSPYPAEFYPPFTYIFLAPMTLIDYPASYVVTTYITLVSYFLFALGIPLWLASTRDYGVIFLLFVTGLFSYGFQFELERGQFYVFTFLLCSFSVYLFHRLPEFKYLAYLLFSISVQLKVIPVFYVFLFIKDWRDWKNNSRRFFGLGLLNIAFLLVLGINGFAGFLQATFAQLGSPGWSWNGNHSVKAFVFNLVKDGYDLVSAETLVVMQESAGVIEKVLLAIILLCMGAVIVRAYQLNEAGFNPFLMLALTIGGLTIAVSNDYTLPVVIAPLALFFCALSPVQNVGKALARILLVLITSIAYASLLFPFKYKPYFMDNSFPPLLIILISVTILYLFVHEGKLGETPVELPKSMEEIHS